jgi:peroxiredoxin
MVVSGMCLRGPGPGTVRADFSIDREGDFCHVVGRASILAVRTALIPATPGAATTTCTCATVPRSLPLHQRLQWHAPSW